MRLDAPNRNILARINFDRTNMKHLLTVSVLLALRAAQAHEGHGPSGPHGHATDVMGFVIGAAAVAGLVWWRGRR